METECRSAVPELASEFNLFGYAVGEVDYVHPYNHGDTKSVWEFNLMEGF